MNQSELERAVARATGESRRFVKRFGFSLVDDEPKPGDELTLAIDCPGCGAVCDGCNLGQGTRVPSVRCRLSGLRRRALRPRQFAPATDRLRLITLRFLSDPKVLRTKLYAVVFHQQ